MNPRDNFIALESRLYRRVLAARCSEFFPLREAWGNHRVLQGGRDDRSPRLSFTQNYWSPLQNLLIFSAGAWREGLHRQAFIGVGTPTSAPKGLAP